MKSVLMALLLSIPVHVQAQCEDENRPDVVVQGQFFAHNTEFFDNPYREGETLLGNHLSAYARLSLGCTAKVHLGAFTDIRAGDESAFRTVRPVVSLVISEKGNLFVLGTLLSRDFIPESGFGHDGLHGLLPPIQNEEFAIERPHETGLQWFRIGRLQSQFWVNWQQLNTPGHREKFDGGWVGRYRLSGPLSVAGQWHVVHHGGQLFDAGQPVADSHAGAAGIILERDRPKLFLLAGPRVFSQITNELYIVGSRHVPDREQDEASLSGHGFFYRSTIRYKGWRIQIIRWWAKDFVKDEGDRNYGFLHDDGTYSPLVGKSRTYKEYGVYREYRPTPALALEGGLKFHDIGNGHTDISYEIRAIFDVKIPSR